MNAKIVKALRALHRLQKTVPDHDLARAFVMLPVIHRERILRSSANAKRIEVERSRVKPLAQRSRTGTVAPAPKHQPKPRVTYLSGKPVMTDQREPTHILRPLCQIKALASYDVDVTDKRCPPDLVIELEAKRRLHRIARSLADRGRGEAVRRIANTQMRG